VSGASAKCQEWKKKTMLQVLKKYGNKPVLIRNFGNRVEQENITKEWVQTIIDPDILSVYTGDKFLNPTKQEFIEKFISDTPRFNLLEGLNPPDNNPHLFSVPSMFQNNWYSGQPHPLVSMVCSTQLSYTKQHTDPAGSGAWMLLLCGEKRWTLIHPNYRSAIYSPLTRIWWDPNAPHDETKSKLPFCENVPSSSIIQRSGDLIWVPPGWPHRVLTITRAIGIGAFYLHPILGVESVQSFIGDASYHLPDAYLGHPNLIELEKDEEKRKNIKNGQSIIDFSVEGREPYFIEILNKNWIRNKEIMNKYHEEIIETEKHLKNWKKHQTREAHIYPEDAVAKYTIY